MLFHLVKKDFLLAKPYWIIMLIAAAALPVFIHTRLIHSGGGGFLPFFLSTLYVIFLLFSTVSTMEYKYRGAALLCATPYTRKAIVRSRYYFIMTLFLVCYMIYGLTALFSPIKIEMLHFADVGRAFLLIMVAFGVIIPVQYRFGYEKSKYIFFFLVFLTPFVLPYFANLFQTRSSLLPIAPPISPFFMEWFFIVAALAIGELSSRISIRVYANQNL
ncbi:ABC-2 transporter permease [Paenibacillus puerhi]|uniref:ABC-2 transporter permease n=1 Tax=Paenibacillus puerhi TaxID=2692622 RepID=UPI00135CE365|nr:ABC-2 transporter permease [Paenibacillus puerhi]